MKKISKSLIYTMLVTLSLSLIVLGCANKQSRVTPTEPRQYIGMNKNVNYPDYLNNTRRTPYTGYVGIEDFRGNKYTGYLDGNRAKGRNVNDYIGYVGDNRENNFITQGRTSANQNLTTTVNNRSNQIARNCNKLSGVNNSTVAISGNTAVVGVDLDKNVEGNLTEDLKRKIESTVKATDKNITNVVVTADIDLYERIKKVGQDIKAGRPLTGLGNELQEIIRRISPK
ncbi:YhcN/YlaJ family sporulation lipoprotein [Tepidibacter formicigenes]|jgi:YhcN/YlaJ family sporulation lipoprotein|uniref:Sporulation lipoprotein, YhcN/YlaJ family n=1 Tax=Tepidibacter formicigenes DSM 15518 TaxID=1123349 RepID=A0A1M6PD90_9FIRM|nr:YhcN/YlaJ family sporulation lipoprotein [Tepidibacter formicigenes]SHK05909.1 sporulation lipoprotein, YhcN/YlaJ family [Tepidibacter formicigenes DSM 15518]